MKTFGRLFGVLCLALLALAAGVPVSPLAAQTIPGLLTVTPLSGFSSSGKAGGPFTPPGTAYTLSNSGTESITWSASNTKSWVTVAPTGGSIAPSGTTIVTVSINPGANSLPPGTYADTVTFTSIAGTAVRMVTLTVSAGPPPTIKIDPPPPSTTTSSPLKVKGTAAPGAPEFLITEVIWNTVNKHFFWGGFAGGTSNWEAEIPLVAGRNDISITAVDGGGGRATTAFTVFYDPLPDGDGGSGGGGCGLTGAEALLMVAGLFLLRRNARRTIPRQ